MEKEQFRVNPNIAELVMTEFLTHLFFPLSFSTDDPSKQALERLIKTRLEILEIPKEEQQAYLDYMIINLDKKMRELIADTI